MSGSGPLARVLFVADRPLTATVTITSSQLVDKDGRDIGHIAQSCRVTFEEMEELGRTLFPMIVGSGRAWDFQVQIPVVLR